MAWEQEQNYKSRANWRKKEESTSGSIRKPGEKVTVKETRRKTACCCALHEYLHLPTGHQKANWHEVITHHLLFIFWQRYVCAISISQSLIFGDGDKKRRYCNLLLLLLFVFTELSGAWCMLPASIFIQKLTYLSKNDFNTLALFKCVQRLWQAFSAMPFMWFMHWHAKGNI